MKTTHGNPTFAGDAAVVAAASADDGAWTDEQTKFLADAIAAVPKSKDAKESERWKKIAACVPGKDAKQCHERYKAQKEQMKAARGA